MNKLEELRKLLEEIEENREKRDKYRELTRYHISMLGKYITESATTDNIENTPEYLNLMEKIKEDTAIADGYYTKIEEQIKQYKEKAKE